MKFHSKKIAVTVCDNVDYPHEEASFCPSTKFKEYPFSEIARQYNGAYDMVRQSLISLGMDLENVGTKQWNPLGEIIRPGQTVLLKPNWVMHLNPEAKYQNMDCLVTHPSIIRAAVDYVLIALKGKGRIIVADSPIKECDFQKLQDCMHYDVIWKYYRSKGIDVEVHDFRGLIENIVEGRPVFIEDESLGVKVTLRNGSCFSELSDKQIKGLRVHLYPPRMMRASHLTNHHEYLIHPEVLSANVIINLPKVKTHKKSGLTACAKNLVGACCRKEQLPHHRTGSPVDGGDEYQNRHILLQMASWFKDRYSDAAKTQRTLARIYYAVFHRLRRVGQICAKEQYDDGAWFGNDTVWRTVVDLNQIMLYADQSGALNEKPQRRIFNICDMIVAGEGYGPLAPTPKRLGMVVAGECIPAVDWFICHAAHLRAELVKYIGRMLQDYGVQLTDYVVISKNGEASPLLSYSYRDIWRLAPPSTWKGNLELE